MTNLEQYRGCSFKRSAFGAYGLHRRKNRNKRLLINYKGMFHRIFSNSLNDSFNFLVLSIRTIPKKATKAGGTGPIDCLKINGTLFL
jgi:hypothetical protein